MRNGLERMPCRRLEVTNSYQCQFWTHRMWGKPIKDSLSKIILWCSKTAWRPSFCSVLLVPTHQIFNLTTTFLFQHLISWNHDQLYHASPRHLRARDFLEPENLDEHSIYALSDEHFQQLRHSQKWAKRGWHSSCVFSHEHLWWNHEILNILNIKLGLGQKKTVISLANCGNLSEVVWPTPWCGKTTSATPWCHTMAPAWARAPPNWFQEGRPWRLEDSRCASAPG